MDTGIQRLLAEIERRGLTLERYPNGSVRVVGHGVDVRARRLADLDPRDFHPPRDWSQDDRRAAWRDSRQ